MKPKSATLRTYQVGFGDCFLLTFVYPTEERHVLIDFGSTGQPESLPGDHMLTVAKNIQERCGGKLHAVVATHRHKDHISGFSTEGQKTGEVIAACNPDVVIQPWTEDPALKTSATKPKSAEVFTNGLAAMHEVAGAALRQLEEFRMHLPRDRANELGFLGEDNLANFSAIKNLQQMGSKHVYAHAGATAGLDEVLPGVTVHVLGPPTLEQTDTIRKQRSKDPDEFWHLQARFWGLQASATAPSTALGLFADYVSAEPPTTSLWLQQRLRELRGDQLLELVRVLDNTMNNTSLILLFEAGTKKLLFPGDAQLENWAFALGQPAIQKLLADVNLYKVGHHGSLNATPKSLWKLFSHRSKEVTADRLQSVVSTMLGKHGSEDRGTEVPRSKLVTALQAESSYFTTQALKPNEDFQDLPIALD